MEHNNIVSTTSHTSPVLSLSAASAALAMKNYATFSNGSEALCWPLLLLSECKCLTTVICIYLTMVCMSLTQYLFIKWLKAAETFWASHEIEVYALALQGASVCLPFVSQVWLPTRTSQMFGTSHQLVDTTRVTERTVFLIGVVSPGNNLGPSVASCRLLANAATWTR